MPDTRVLNAVTISSVQATPSTKINNARSDAQFGVKFTAPSATSGRFAAQIEVGPGNNGPWTPTHIFSGLEGGISPRTGLPYVYQWAGGVTPEMVGKWVRINFTTVVGSWTLDATLST